MTKRLLIISCASMVGLFSLAGCDVGPNQTWEAIEYEGVPYTEERTAGRGVKYVLAALAPKRGPVLEPIMDTTKKVMPQSAPRVSLPPPPQTEIKNATPIFNDQMGKSK